MKIDFSEEHKEKILDYIEKYKDISNKVKSLQEEFDKTTEKLQSIREDEKIYMDELHSIYGDFTLNDLYESIY